MCLDTSFENSLKVSSSFYENKLDLVIQPLISLYQFEFDSYTRFIQEKTHSAFTSKLKHEIESTIRYKLLEDYYNLKAYPIGYVELNDKVEDVRKAGYGLLLLKQDNTVDLQKLPHNQNSVEIFKLKPNNAIVSGIV